MFKSLVSKIIAILWRRGWVKLSTRRHNGWCIIIWSTSATLKTQLELLVNTFIRSIHPGVQNGAHWPCSYGPIEWMIHYNWVLVLFIDHTARRSIRQNSLEKLFVCCILQRVQSPQKNQHHSGMLILSINLNVFLEHTSKQAIIRAAPPLSRRGQRKRSLFSKKKSDDPL